MTTLVVGVGNAWRGDDAAGLEVAQLLRRAAPDGTQVVEHEGDPSGLIDAWEGEDEVVLVDAVSSGAPPGTVYRLNPLEKPLPAELFRRSTHQLGVAEAVEMARVLDRLPARLAVYGIEGRSFHAGEPLCPQVRQAVGRVASELAGRLTG